MNRPHGAGDRWRTALDERAPRRLDPALLGDRVVVVSAHPDDETLAVGGLMRTLRQGGARLELVVATDGEAASGPQTGSARAELGRRRHAELAGALHTLGLADVPVRWLGLPDSGLVADAVAEEVVAQLADADSYLAPWPDDPHPDHAAAGLGAATAAAGDTLGWTYPIWMWPRLDPDHQSVPWSRAFTHRLSQETAAAKVAAIGRFTSQLHEGPGGAEPVLTEDVLRHFRTGTELVFRQPAARAAPRQRFDRLYREADGDPWHTRDSWYERRKRDVVLACLPRARYRHAGEPGCGTGALTRELAGRCERVSATDFVEQAVAETRRSTVDHPEVRVERTALPDGVPAGVDLVVLSEVLYYLAPDQLRATVDRVAGALVPGGDLVVVHWRGWPADAPSEPSELHRRLAADARFEPLVEHIDTEFLLHVLRRRDTGR